MSYYYNYYIGYRDKDGKYYPVGPFDCEGNLWPVISNSRSFASDLYSRCRIIPDQEKSEELRARFREEETIRSMDVENLPDGDYIKRGYFLLSDIQTYLKTGDPFGLFYVHLTPEMYAIQLENELKFGKSANSFTERSEEDEYVSCSELAYFAYPDRSCEEYDAYVLRNAVHNCSFYSFAG